MMITLTYSNPSSATFSSLLVLLYTSIIYITPLINGLITIQPIQQKQNYQNYLYSKESPCSSRCSSLLLSTSGKTTTGSSNIQNNYNAWNNNDQRRRNLFKTMSNMLLLENLYHHHENVLAFDDYYDNECSNGKIVPGKFFFKYKVYIIISNEKDKC